MRLTPVVLSLLLAAAIPTGSALAEYQFINVSESPGNSICGNVACSHGTATLVAWEESPREIWSRAFTGSMWLDPVHHGQGDSPALAWGRAVAILAYASDMTIVVQEGTGAAWGDPILFGGDEAVFRPNLWCSGTDTPDQAYLTWETASNQIRFTRRTAQGWSDPVTVVGWSGFDEEPVPHVVPYPTAAGFAPRIYYLNQMAMKYRQLEDGGWSDPMVVTTLTMAGADFDVAADIHLRHHILSLGPQPT